MGVVEISFVVPPAPVIGLLLVAVHHVSSPNPFHDLSDDIDIVWTVVRWVPYEDRTRLCDLVLAR